jgi:hypothetical protein
MSRPTALVDDSTPPTASAPAEPSEPDECIDRGLWHLARGEISSAEAKFEAAHRRRPGARSAALWGFCRSRRGDHQSAANFYQEAVTRDGDQPAWVHNNLAYGLTMSAADSPDAMKRAAAAAASALALNGNLPAARLNRAWAQYLGGLNKRKRVLDPACVPGLEESVGMALKAEPPITEAYLLAGLVYAASAADQPDRLDRAINFLCEGVCHGLSPTQIKSDVVLRTHLGSRSDFVNLCDQPIKPLPPGGLNPRLIAPPVW